MNEDCECKIDFSKPLRARNGLEVDIWTTCAKGNNRYPVRGQVFDAAEGRWVLAEWTKDGKFFANRAFQHHFDLVNVPIKESWYVNIYKNDNARYAAGMLHENAKIAADKASEGAVARIRIEFTPGQFDD